MKELETQISEITREFKQAFGNLPAEELNRKPDAKSWSIGQIIEHLILINESYFQSVKETQAADYKPPFTARFGFLSNLAGFALLKAVEPSNQKKTKTFGLWAPQESAVEADILNRFEKNQEELKQFLHLDENLIVSSPANRNITLKLGQLIHILIVHEQRHLQQAKQVLSHIHSLSS